MRGTLSVTTPLPEESCLPVRSRRLPIHTQVFAEGNVHEGVISTLDGTRATDQTVGLDRMPGQELRFMELVARAWLEPELSRRYQVDATSVLDEFGVTLAQGQQPPSLPENPVGELTIEELSRPTTAHAFLCFCLTEDVSPEARHTSSGTGSRRIVR
jgi:putative thiazole/oxazole-modified microcin (TOMM)-like peptide